MDVDFLIVGQGLAGSAMAMALLERGQSIAVVDRQDTHAATRVAAGLVTTLAGKGMNPAWRQAEYLPVAMAYYQRLERECGRQIFYPHPVLRMFANAKEAEKFARKRDAVAEWVGCARPEISADQVHAASGGFEMAQGGRLDTVAYLELVRKKIEQAAQYIEGDFSEADLQVAEDCVRWNGIAARKVIYCQGFAGLESGSFSRLQHRSAKGEMLTVRVNDLDQSRILNRNGWMVPIGDSLWRAGATYEWDDLSAAATPAGRAEVERKIADLTPLGFEVVHQEVGVRPIIHRSQPVVGLDSDCPQVGFFNGLGSKGVITAPSVAAHFADFLCGRAELDPELSIERLADLS